jgi:hypothetical protein
MHTRSEGFTLYLCYAQKEKTLRVALEAHLQPLKQQGLITTWHDGEIRAGAEWQSELRLHLQTADIILLLISSNFLASDNLYREGMLEALGRHERGEAVVIPILMRPVDWEATSISKLRILPSNGRAVTEWSNRDAAFLDIAREVRAAVENMLADSLLNRPEEASSASETSFTADKRAARRREAGQLDPAIFFFNAPFIDANEFYGRRRAYSELLDNATKRASTSIVGPRRIGKTWLLAYLKQTISARFGSRFPVASLDATSPRCATIGSFVSFILEEWGLDFLSSSPESSPMAHLERVVKEMRRREMIPLLCIDEFERLTHHEDIFDLQFFDNLRSIAGSGLVLMVASKRPPFEFISQEFQTSPFFNILVQVTLKPFDEREADAFIQAKGDQAGFTAQEREYFKLYGKIDGQSWPPARLQLVGTLLLEEKTFAGQAGSAAYQPADPSYWRAFAQRLEELYQTVVR